MNRWIRRARVLKAGNVQGQIIAYGGKKLWMRLVPIQLVVAVLVLVFLGLAILGGASLLGPNGVSNGQGSGQTCTTQTVTEPVPVQASPSTIPTVYSSIFTQAADAMSLRGYPVDVDLLATVFYEEHGRNFPNPPPPYGTGPAWAVSGPGAMGPFQFMPGTWKSHAQDGNGDGVKDVNDLIDAAYGAAELLSQLGGKPGTPLGNPSDPHAKPSLVNVLASYNAGPAGNFNVPETVRYVTNGAVFYRKLQQQTASVVSSPSPTQIQNCVPNQDAASCPTEDTSDNNISQVYLLGDDLAAQMQDSDIGDLFGDEGVNLYVSAVPGRSIGSGPTPNGLQQVKLDQDRITNANVLVVELGTNYAGASLGSFTAQVSQLVSAIRKLNPIAPLYWVNIANNSQALTAAGPLYVINGQRNQALDQLAVQDNFQVINWFNTVFPEADPHVVDPKLVDANGWLAGDPNHIVPNDEGTRALETVIAQVVTTVLVPADAEACGGGNTAAEAAIAYAKSKLNTPYLYGGTGTAAENGEFDCSGLTQAAYGAAGITLERTAQAQYDQLANESRLITDPSQLQPGDLVFFGTSTYIHHVGIYLSTDANGDQWMIDAPHTGAVIRQEVFNNLYHSIGRDYYGAGQPA